MKKYYLILQLLLAFGSSSRAQTFEWAKSFGDSLDDIGQSIAVDASGNVFTTGNFEGTVDFDPGAGIVNLTSAGSSDVFVQKLDALGNFLWAKSFSGNLEDIGRSIAVDVSGNVYTTGYFRGTVDFDPGTGTANHTSAGITDVFVQKLDASGNFLWAKSFGGSNNDQGLSIVIDASGNVYTTGIYKGTVDFDPGAGTAYITYTGNFDCFVQKLDASGNFIWAKSFGASLSSDIGYSITVDASGNVYTTGIFLGTVDFDPGAGTANLVSTGYYDAFVQKLDASGNFIWAKSFGGSLSNDYGESIKADASGNVYITGHFSETGDFDPGAGTANLTSAGSNDVFVQKLDASGNFLWAKSFGGGSTDRGHSIALDTSGNVYTTGFFQGLVDFDPGAGIANISSGGGYNVFVQKLDGSGNFLWAKSFGGSSLDQGNSIAVDASDNIYTTGSFQGTVDFDPGAGTTNLGSAGSYDVFIQKLSQCAPNTGTDMQTSCDSYTWIDGNTYTTSNNTATHTLTNTGGCDSVVTLNLTINNSYTETDVITACDGYTWIDGITYTASNNTATQVFTNVAGCDSVVTLDLTINSVSDITTSLTGSTITATNSNTTYQWLDCDNNNAVINGETNQTFTATINGNYAVELTENGCVDTTSCVSITAVGILENNFGNALTVYPNPTTGSFSIDLGKVYVHTEILITDLSGKLIYSKTITQSQNINLKIEEPAGIYIVSIQAGDKKAVIRLVKE